MAPSLPVADSPVSPLRLAEGAPWRVNAHSETPPIPLGPDAQSLPVEDSVISAKAGIQVLDTANPAIALDPRLRGDDSFPGHIPATPDGLAIQARPGRGKRKCEPRYRTHRRSRAPRQASKPGSNVNVWEIQSLAV